MVSMIRKDKGFVFQTEWGLSKIRTAMMDSPAMMESILNLIWDGKNDEKLHAFRRSISKIWQWILQH